MVQNLQILLDYASVINFDVVNGKLHTSWSVFTAEHFAIYEALKQFTSRNFTSFILTLQMLQRA